MPGYFFLKASDLRLAASLSNGFSLPVLEAPAGFCSATDFPFTV